MAKAKTKKKEFPVEKYAEKMFASDVLLLSHGQTYTIFLQELLTQKSLIADHYEDKELADINLSLAKKGLARSLKAILQEYDKWKENRE